MLSLVRDSNVIAPVLVGPRGYHRSYKEVMIIS
jgi:hypothetical protein